MFCSKCGKQNADNSKFCSACGAVIQPISPVRTQSPVSRPVAQQQANAYTPYKPTATAIKTPTVYSTHPIINAVKSMGASPLFIVAVVLFTLYLFFNLLSVVSSGNNIFSNIESILDAFGLYEDEVYELFSALRGMFVGAGIFGMVPSIIVCIGLWIVFSSCIDKSSDSLKTSGFTTIKAVSVYNLVINCIGAGLALVPFFYGIVLMIVGNSSSSSGDTSSSSVNAVAYNSKSLLEVLGVVNFVIGIVLTLIFAYLIFYQAKIIKTINTIKETAITGVPSMKVSSFVAVICFISAGFSFIGMCIASSGALDVFAKLCNIAAVVCFGMLLLKYKNKMQTLISSSVSYSPIEEDE